MVGGLDSLQLGLELRFESLLVCVGHVSLSCRGVQFEASSYLCGKSAVQH